MAAGVADQDLYAVLGLSWVEEPPLSDVDIKKAYRKRALECHPDKRPGDQAAAAEFNRLQQAYEVLSDQDARKAYDAVRRIKREREARLGQHGSKRQRMVAELEERERQAERQRNQEESARAQLKRELERLQKEAAAKRARSQASAAGATPSSGDGPGASGLAAGGAAGEEMLRTLKVSWRVPEGELDRYSPQELRSVFRKFGEVEDIVVRETKKKGSSRRSALVVMATFQAARAATLAQGGDSLNSLQVSLAAPQAQASIPGSASSTWDSPFAAHTAHNLQKPAQNQADRPAPDVQNGAGQGPGKERGDANDAQEREKPPARTGFQPSTVGSSYKDYESAILQKMMKAAARSRMDATTQATTHTPD